MCFWNEIKIAVQRNFSAFHGQVLLHQFRSGAGIIFNLVSKEPLSHCSGGLPGVCSLYIRSGEQRDASPRYSIRKTTRPGFSMQCRVEIETTSMAVGLVLHWCCLGNVFILNAKGLCCLAKTIVAQICWLKKWRSLELKFHQEWPEEATVVLHTAAPVLALA